MSLTKHISRQNEGNGTGTWLYDDAIVLEGHTGSVLTAKFSDNGELMASGGMDKEVLLWKLPIDSEENDANLGKLVGNKSAVTSLKWLNNDSYLVTSSDTTVAVWDTDSGRKVRKLNGHESCVNEVATTNDDMILSVSDDGSTCIWDLREKEPTFKIESDYPMLTGTFSNSGQNIYVSGIDPTLIAYDMRNMEKPLWKCQASYESVTSVAINKDDSVLLTRSMNGNVKTFSARDFVPKGMARESPYVYSGAPSGQEYLLIRACFGDNNMLICTGSEDMSMTVWDFTTRNIKYKFSGHKGTVVDVDYHPTENISLSTSTDGNIILRKLSR